MRLIQVCNFKKEGGAVIDIGNTNNFTCQFSQAITIAPNSKICLVHAEINDVVSLEDTGITLQSTSPPTTANLVQKTTQPKNLVYINCPSLPVSTAVGMSNGGKGQVRNIVGIAKTNDNDKPFTTGIEVDLHNTQPLVLTELTIQILDSDYDLYGFTSTSRQMITFGIKECKCDMKKGGARAY
jgi:hypothetical protein